MNVSIGEMRPDELAAFVCQALANAGIEVVLTGGACAAIWSRGRYESKDIDFVERGMASRRDVRKVMSSLGFRERGREFEHDETPFTVEFPSGPLAVGDEPVREIQERILKTGRLRLLSPTDCVKDRLAAFYHWKDSQSLEQAAAVVAESPVDLAEVERWSVAEGALTEFTTFRRYIKNAERD